jgi:predicted transcriptional regulator YdeE
VAKTLPAHRYALFTHKGPVQTLMKSYAYIYGIWFANNDVKKNPAFDIELYTHNKQGRSVIQLLILILD